MVARWSDWDLIHLTLQGHTSKMATSYSHMVSSHMTAKPNIPQTLWVAGHTVSQSDNYIKTALKVSGDNHLSIKASGY